MYIIHLFILSLVVGRRKVHKNEDDSRRVEDENVEDPSVDIEVPDVDVQVTVASPQIDLPKIDEGLPGPGENTETSTEEKGYLELEEDYCKTDENEDHLMKKNESSESTIVDDGNVFSKLLYKFSVCHHD